jgi:hypothetical protein
MISQQHYADGTQDGWRHGVCDVSIEPETTVFCYPQAPDCGEAGNLAEFAAGRNSLLWLTPELHDCCTLNLDSPTLEPFYAFYYFSRPDHWVACRDLVPITSGSGRISERPVSGLPACWGTLSLCTCVAATSFGSARIRI